MLERVRNSLAVRLVLPYALVFALAAGLLFGGLYFWLSNTVGERDQAIVEEHAARLAQVCENGGVEALSRQLRDNLSPEMRSLFVRLISPKQEAVFVAAPPNWIETEVRRLPVPEWAGIMTEERRQTVRVPQNALRDYTIASHLMRNGWLLQVGRLAESRSVLLAPLRQAFAWAGAATALVSLAVGTLLSWRTTAPLRAVAQTADRILETGNLDARVPEPAGRGELATLVRQLNTLLERNARHLRNLRQTHDNLAHDLRTPLTRLRGSAELAMQETEDPAEARAALAECVNESDRLLHMLETLLDISSAEDGSLRLNRDTCDLRELLTRTVDLYSEVAEAQGVTVTLTEGPAAQVNADRVRLGQVLNNLLDNAIKYSPEGGAVHVELSLIQDKVQVLIDDSGPGIPEAEREAVFRRLYRSDSSRSKRGFGLGLSLVKAIVEAHQGSVTVESAPSGGARLRLELPCAS